jgi:hypothetical protein
MMQIVLAQVAVSPAANTLDGQGWRQAPDRSVYGLCEARWQKV